MLENNKWVKWGSATLTVLIVAGFLLQDRLGGSMLPKQVSFATIDGRPISSKKLFQILDYQVKRIKASAPHLTAEDFKVAHFPEQVLNEYIIKLVKSIELQRQGFVISEPTLISKLGLYGKDFVKHFQALDVEKKKAILDDVRLELLEQQLVLPYQLPDSYQEALYTSMHSPRHYDLISIDFDKIPADTKALNDAELQDVISRNPQEFMEGEKRSFALINLHKQPITLTDAELLAYYNANKSVFVKPGKTLPKFPEVKSQVVNRLRHEKLSAFTRELRNKIESEEMDIQDIKGAPVESFNEVTKETPFKYSINVLNAAFEMDLEVLDLFEDPVTGDLFAVQVTSIKPEAQMQGEVLKKAATRLWAFEKKEAGAKALAETLFSLEENSKAFYECAQKNHLTIQRDLSVDRAREQKNLTPDLFHRIFSVPAGKVVYGYTPTGIVLARVTKDELYKSKGTQTKEVRTYFLRAAFNTVLSLFSQEITKHHKIERNVKALYEECQF